LFIDPPTPNARHVIRESRRASIPFARPAAWQAHGSAPTGTSGPKRRNRVFRRRLDLHAAAPRRCLGISRRDFVDSLHLPALDFDRLGTLFVVYGLNVIGALLIALAGWWLAGVFERLSKRTLLASSHMDVTVAAFLSSLVRYAMLAVTLVLMLQVVGIQAAAWSPCSVPRRSRSAWRCRERSPTWRRA
jgi:hypothetical protein